MTPDHLRRARLANHLLTGTRPEDPAGVVRHLGAMQAQDLGQALWAVGSRLHGGTRAAVEAALEQAEIVRSWPFRGTIHLMAAADVRWLMALGTPRMATDAARRLAALGLSAEDLSRAARVAEAAFTTAGAPLLTRAELTGAFEAGGIATAGQRGYHLLWRLSMDGLLCLGPMRDTEQTFALLDAWVPDPGPVERDEALTRLAARFATSHGPVTAHDLARWSGLTITDARRGLAAASELVQVDVGGVPHWLPATGGRPATDWEKPMLLAGFDEYLIGYQAREAILDAAHAGLVVPGANGVFRPMVVIGGRVVGTWSRRLTSTGLTSTGLTSTGLTSTGLTVTVAPFEPGTIDLGALGPAVQAYQAFLQLDPDVPVEVTPARG